MYIAPGSECERFFININFEAKQKRKKDRKSEKNWVNFQYNGHRLGWVMGISLYEHLSAVQGKSIQFG